MTGAATDRSPARLDASEVPGAKARQDLQQLGEVVDGSVGTKVFRPHAAVVAVAHDHHSHPGAPRGQDIVAAVTDHDGAPALGPKPFERGQNRTRIGLACRHAAAPNNHIEVAGEVQSHEYPLSQAVELVGADRETEAVVPEPLQGLRGMASLAATPPPRSGRGTVSRARSALRPGPAHRWPRRRGGRAESRRRRSLGSRRRAPEADAPPRRGARLGVALAQRGNQRLRLIGVR